VSREPAATTTEPSRAVTPTGRDTTLELSIARLLTGGTYLSIVLILVGVVGLIVSGTSPLQGGPPFDPGRLSNDVTSLRPEGFLWAGLLLVIATPSARVAASLVGYARRGEREMTAVAILILAVIALSVLVVTATEQ
jgi:uncharacterized membrane protein